MSAEERKKDLLREQTIELITFFQEYTKNLSNPLYRDEGFKDALKGRELIKPFVLQKADHFEVHKLQALSVVAETLKGPELQFFFLALMTEHLTAGALMFQESARQAKGKN